MTSAPNSVAGLKQWLDADQLGLADAAAVSTWADASGNSYDFTAVNAPAFRTNQVNGKPCVDFDKASSHYLTFPGFPEDVFTRWTAFVVWRPDDSTFANTLWNQDRAGYNDDFLFGMDPANINSPNTKVSFQVQQASGSSLRTVTEANDVTTGEWRVNDFRYDGSALDLYLNGDLEASLSVAGLQIDANTQWQLGRSRGAAGWYFDGGLAELVFYNVALSDTDRDAVRAGLGEKYGISIAGVSPPVTVSGEPWSTSSALLDGTPRTTVRVAGESWSVPATWLGGTIPINFPIVVTGEAWAAPATLLDGTQRVTAAGEAWATPADWLNGHVVGQPITLSGEALATDAAWLDGIAFSGPSRAGLGIVLDSSAVLTVNAVLEPEPTAPPGTPSTALHVIAPTVPVPTLVAGRPT